MQTLFEILGAMALFTLPGALLIDSLIPRSRPPAVWPPPKSPRTLAWEFTEECRKTTMLEI